jgi:hypothetical protein
MLMRCTFLGSAADILGRLEQIEQYRENNGEDILHPIKICSILAACGPERMKKFVPTMLYRFMSSSSLDSQTMMIAVDYPAYSILMLGSDGKTTTTRAPAAGAFYTDTASNKPRFGTLPVAQGGLGITSITKGAILYGNTSSTTGAVSALSPGTNGYVLISTGSAPKYV